MPTDKLRLVEVSADMKAAMDRSREEFARLLGATLPPEWPQFPHAFRPIAVEHPSPWTGYLFLNEDGSGLVGNGGYVGPPNECGEVEIGYEIAPSFWNRGYATQAAAALVRQAFEHGALTVVAHSLAGPNASNSVMKKIGMTFVEPRKQGDHDVWLWRVRAGDSARRDAAAVSRNGA